MTPDLLRRVGEALYGPQWQSALARDCGVAIRTMQRWAAGDSPIPDTLHLDLIDLCREHEETLRDVRGELRSL